MASFLTDPEMMEHLKGVLHQVSTDKTPDYWTNLARWANRNAYRTILDILLGRGYTKAQILAWPSGPDYQRDLGVFWSVVKGGCVNTGDFDSTLLKYLDRREELAEVIITDTDDEVVDPSASSSFGSGALSTTSDIFVHPDPNSADLGEVTDF